MDSDSEKPQISMLAISSYNLEFGLISLRISIHERMNELIKIGYKITLKTNQEVSYMFCNLDHVGKSILNFH